MLYVLRSALWLSVVLLSVVRELLLSAYGSLLASSWLRFALCAFLVYGCSQPVNKVLEGTGLSFACAVGDVTDDRAIVWLRAERESSVSVHYGREPGLTKYRSSRKRQATGEIDFTAQILIGGLQPKTTYYYRATVAGRTPGPICRFVTAPRMDDSADVLFAFGGDTKEGHQPFRIMDAIRAKDPDFFLHLGDTIYADAEGAAYQLPQFWAKYRRNRNDLPTQRLFSETSLYVTWDDHEVSGNYHPDNPLASIGRRAFFDYWPIRRDPQHPNRLYRSFRWGKAVELFILDTRQYRDISQGTILGSEQKQWLLNGLSSSPALFKFVATSVPISSRRNADKWGGFPVDRKEVLRTIRREQISGVIFLAADVHYAAVARIPGSRRVLREIIVGPLAAPTNRRSRGTAKRFEFFSKDYLNYGLIKVHAQANPPYAEIEILDEDNNLIHRTRMEPPSWDR